MLSSLWGFVRGSKTKKLTAKERGRQARAKGHAFEAEVASLLSSMGHRNIVTNYRTTDRFGHRSEIDIVTGWFFKTYVECKKYDSQTVPLEDVAKFKEVLRINGISPRQGLFVTNSRYSPRATTTGIRTIDGERLASLRWQQRFGILALRTGMRRAVWWSALAGLCGMGWVVLTGLEKGLGADLHERDKWASGRNRRVWAQHSAQVALEAQNKVHRAVDAAKAAAATLAGGANGRGGG